MGRMEHSASRSSQGDNLSYFLEDPGTGTLYRRGQLLGKVEREIELHSHLSHRHVVGFHRHFADRDNIYMILEYCSHKSLAHILKARKTLTEPEVRYYLRQIIAGLRYLHQQGIIHRDLKLSNFFLTKNMQVKIGDLGLATRDEQAGRRRGVVCGTPNYLAPEVIAKKGHSFQSDIWALGCIMYTALTGCSPFEITHKQEMYQCIREGRYPIPNHLSPGARKLIGCLLAPSPSERPSLEEVLEHEFFTQGFTPDKLPSRACHSVPVFALPNPIGKLLKKAAKVLFRGLPCQEPRAGSPVPGEELEKLMSRSQQAQNLPSQEQHSEVERGSVQAAPFPEAPSMFSIHLLMTGALRPSRSGANSDAGWSVASAVQSVTRVLGSCLENMPLAEHNPVQRLAPPVLWVTRWVDYSNKYGFGYLLSDGSTGALLADGTHLALCPQSLRVCYCPGCGEAVSFPRSDVPTSLATKMGVLHFFSQYMQQKLLEGGNEPAGPSSSTDAPCLLCCAKSDRALLMLFSNGTLQVNFYHDHTKLVLGCPGDGHLLTFIDEQRVSATFPLGALAAEGCAPALRERLQYALDMAHCL
ncbi:inactive serine/threonine-protein kinase PLK5 isoform X4 [Chrysemys picta bellii]|uniref:inactive serine/threonine-protein kinase PLK5 isoform X4 n=1 Tax=Chrysemys picta bellii TaxID=8478 RepID=UPI001C682D54|nr:inactive serine/threonine-protein kinase PLK5 isoform X4 [Chrysemys picta bellii]